VEVTWPQGSSMLLAVHRRLRSDQGV